MSDSVCGFGAYLPDEVDLLRLARIAREALGFEKEGREDHEDGLPGRNFLVLSPDVETGIVALTLSGAVAPRTPGEDFDAWSEDAALPRLLSRELGVIVYVWAYENQVGRESLQVFVRGEPRPRDLVHWDETAGREQDDGPLARLARTLGTTRSRIELEGLGGKRSLSIDLACCETDRARLETDWRELRAATRGPASAPGEAELLETLGSQNAEEAAWDRQHVAYLERERKEKERVARLGKSDPASIDGCFAGLFAGLLGGALAAGLLASLPVPAELTASAAALAAIGAGIATARAHKARRSRRSPDGAKV
jgi:hypothetical protein